MKSNSVQRWKFYRWATSWRVNLRNWAEVELTWQWLLNSEAWTSVCCIAPEHLDRRSSGQVAHKMTCSAVWSRVGSSWERQGPVFIPDPSGSHYHVTTVCFSFWEAANEYWKHFNVLMSTVISTAFVGCSNYDSATFLWFVFLTNQLLNYLDCIAGKTLYIIEVFALGYLVYLFDT